MQLLILIVSVLSSCILGALLFILLKKMHNMDMAQRISVLEHDLQRFENLLRDEMGRNRTELAATLQQNREEVVRSLGTNEKRFIEFISTGNQSCISLQFRLRRLPRQLQRRQ